LTDAKINASTFANQTYFHCHSHCPQTFILAINYLLNGLLNPVFIAKDLACEIHDGKASGVIYRELIGAEQEEQLANAKPKDEFLYGGDSTLIGNLSLIDLTRFHQRFYQASNITLVTANADIEQIANIISLLPKQKSNAYVDVKKETIKPIKKSDDSKSQKKYSKEITQLITLYQQWLQEPNHQEVTNLIDVKTPSKSPPPCADKVQAFIDSRLISPLMALSNTLKMQPVNEQESKANVKNTPKAQLLPNLFANLYQQTKDQLTKQINQNRYEIITYANNNDNALWLTHINEVEQRLANIVSYMISAHPVFLSPRCQGKCYAMQALTLENSNYLVIYSAFDISPSSRLKKISSYLLTISQDKSFIIACLHLAKIKYCRAEHVEIKQVNDITPTSISTYLQLLANRSSS
jgi:hypothetical protein